MTQSHNNNNSAIPEHELLEFIEGTLCAEREVVVRAALAREPRLARLAAGMREDRRVMMDLGAVQAPGGMTERVEGVLERQALFGLAEVGTIAIGAGPAGQLPVSMLTPTRPSVVVRVWRRSGRALAAAAVLGLLGAGAYLLAESLRRPAETPADSTLALEDAAGGVDVAGADGVDDGAVAVAADVGEPGIGEAVAGAEDEATMLASAEPEPVEPADAADAAFAVAAADAAGPAEAEETELPAAITPGRALELAMAGKLAIVVRAEDADAAVARVESLARSSVRTGWRRIDDGESGAAMAALPAQYATVALLWQAPIAPSHPQPWHPFRPPVAVAGEHDVGRVEALDARLPRLPFIEFVEASAVQPSAVFVASVEDRAGSLAGLLAGLKRDTLPRQSARFVELPVGIDGQPSADPEAVLWWTTPAAAWGSRVQVPVVVMPAVAPGR